jgi:hypothetical protein
VGGKESRTSTPILPFPPHKGEGDEIRNNQINTENTIEQYLHKKPDFFSRSIGVIF